MSRPDHVVTPAMRNAESKAEVDHLDVLLAERHTLVQKVAPLRAKYGPGGIWDAQRKLRLSQLAAAIRGRAVEAGERVTEARIDEAAHASNEYAAFIEAALLERIEWAELEDRIQGISDTIQRGNAIIRFTTSEAMLAR